MQAEQSASGIAHGPPRARQRLLVRQVISSCWFDSGIAANCVLTKLASGSGSGSGSGTDGRLWFWRLPVIGGVPRLGMWLAACPNLLPELWRDFWGCSYVLGHVIGGLPRSRQDDDDDDDDDDDVSGADG